MSQPDLIEELRLSARRRNAVGMCIVASALVFGSAFLVYLIWPEAVDARLDGERDVLGNFVYRPAASSAPADIDLEQVHSDLFPRWAISVVHRDTRGLEAEQKNWNQLMDAVEPDANLVALAAEIRTHALSEDVSQKSERLRYLTWAWSDYLRSHDAPYLLQSNIMRLKAGDYFYLKSYRIEEAVSVTASDRPYGVRVVRRLDSTNIRELYLGATGRDEEESIVLLDRLDEFGRDHIWPLMSDSSEVKAGGEIREYLRPRLGAHYAILSRTAVHRDRMQSVVDALKARDSCMVIRPPKVGIRGVSKRELEFLEDTLIPEDERDESDCESITVEELLVLEESTASLRAESGDLEGALSALAHALVPAVAVHEARHLADADTFGAALAVECEECWTAPEHVRAEVSAYLASFAHESGALAFYQACSAMERGSGAHGHAMEKILTVIEADCDGIPENLAERARSAEEQLFGRVSDSIVNRP